MKSKKAKAAIERYRKAFLLSVPSEELAEHCRLFKEIAEIAEQELLSEFIPAIRKAYFAFNDLIAVFPALKNEPIFIEIKELFKKYENEND